MRIRALSTVLMLLLASSSLADDIVIDFEGLADFSPVTNQFEGVEPVGVTFSSATVLTKGISLNSFFFPPRSGTNVIFDFPTGTIGLAFTGPVTKVAGFVTGNRNVTLTAFNSSGAACAST